MIKQARAKNGAGLCCVATVAALPESEQAKQLC